MTKEEKEAVLHCLRAMIDEELCEECPLYGTTGTDHCEKDCVRLAIEELEQEPCEDAISRQKMLDGLASIAKARARSGAQKALMGRVMFFTEKLPPVNPQKPCKDCQYKEWLEGEDLPSVNPKQSWIPVSERLPEKSTWVLVTCKNPDGYIFLDIKLINRYTGLWDGDEDFIGTVLAWMPLPEPYKAESEEEA